MQCSCSILPKLYITIIDYLKASPLPPAPLAAAGFIHAGLVAWQYYDRLAGLLGFAVCFLFRYYSLLECLPARWFMHVVAWQYSDRLAGLLAFAVWFLLC